MDDDDDDGGGGFLSIILLLLLVLDNYTSVPNCVHVECSKQKWPVQEWGRLSSLLVAILQRVSLGSIVVAGFTMNLKNMTP